MVSCPSIKRLKLYGVDSIAALWPHQIPTSYFSKLEELEVQRCRKLRNLMSPSLARGVLNLRILIIIYCSSMEQVIIGEEQGEAMTNVSLLPRLEMLKLSILPKLGHFFQTDGTLEFPFLSEVQIYDCPAMKTFVVGSVSTPSLIWLTVEPSKYFVEHVEEDVEKHFEEHYEKDVEKHFEEHFDEEVVEEYVKESDPNKVIWQIFNSEKQKASDGNKSEAGDGDCDGASDGIECEVYDGSSDGPGGGR